MREGKTANDIVVTMRQRPSPRGYPSPCHTIGWSRSVIFFVAKSAPVVARRSSVYSLRQYRFISDVLRGRGSDKMKVCRCKGRGQSRGVRSWTWARAHLAHVGAAEHGDLDHDARARLRHRVLQEVSRCGRGGGGGEDTDRSRTRKSTEGRGGPRELACGVRKVLGQSSPGGPA